MSAEVNSTRFRHIAGRQMAEQPVNTADLSPEDARALIHELRVHQIELELQNEALKLTQLELDASRRKSIDPDEVSPVVRLTTLDDEDRILAAMLELSQPLIA